MTHHDHHHHHHGNAENLRAAFFLNLGFTLIELVGGLLTNSVAILSDALHDLGDSLALGLAWFLQNYANKGSDPQFSYGYRRFSLLGAVINALVLTVGSVFILIETVPRLLSPEPFNAVGMIGLAVLGVAVNGFAAYRLRGDKGSNAEVMSLHLLEDVLGWVAVLIVGVISLFVSLPILDPLLALAIAAYILYNVVQKLIGTVELFLQRVPGNIDLERVRRDLVQVDNVESAHHLHIWSLDGEHHVLTAHLVVAEHITREDLVCIKQGCRDAVHDLELEHITLEFEFGDEDCSMHHDHAHEEAAPA